MSPLLAKRVESTYNYQVRRGLGTREKGVLAMKVKSKKEQGMSLVEVLVTIFILAVVCLTLISVFIYGFNLLAKTKQTALATQVAQFEIERYRNMNFTAIIAGTTASNFVDLYGNDVNSPYKFLFSKDNDAYLLNGRETITIQDGVTIGMDDKIKKLTVTVEWDYRTRTVGRGNPMRKDVVTYFSQDGINRR